MIGECDCFKSTRLEEKESTYTMQFNVSTNKSFRKSTSIT